MLGRILFALCLNAVLVSVGWGQAFSGREPALPPTGWSNQEVSPAEFVSPRGQSRGIQQTSYQPMPVGQLFGTDHQFPTVQLTGFFQADAGWIHQSGANREAVGDAQDGADFRRARLQAKGDVWDNVGYSVEFDFGFAGRPSFMDIWLEVREVFGDASVRVGHYRQPIGMTGQNSVTALPFIERPLPFALLPFRQIGVMVHGTGPDDATTWALSVFRFPTDAFGGNAGDNGGYGFVTRLTGLAVDDGDRLVHIGAAYNFADPSSNALQYASPPEFFVGQAGVAALSPPLAASTMPPFVNTGPIAANNYNLLGGEFAARSGSFYMQSEVLVSVVDQATGGTAVFPGVYVHAGYFLTGEVRPYDRKAGVLGRVTPLEPFSRSGGRGAWELAARWSMLDLNDAGIRGGRLNDITLGLNWYLNPFVKFQMNYIHAMLNSPVNGHSEADIAALRAQLTF